MSKYQKVLYLSVLFFLGSAYGLWGKFFVASSRKRNSSEAYEEREPLTKTNNKRAPASILQEIQAPTIHSPVHEKENLAATAELLLADDDSYEEEGITESPKDVVVSGGSDIFNVNPAPYYGVPSSALSGNSGGTSQGSSSAGGFTSSYTNVSNADAFFPSTGNGTGNSGVEKGALSYKVSSISFKDGMIVIKGKNLHTIKSLSIKELSEGTLSKVSSSEETLAAMGISALKLALGKVYSLVIADAYGASTYPIQIELADGSISAAKLSPLNPSEDGYVLKWDAGAQRWIASPDEVGAGPDGGITSITKGEGILGKGGVIDSVGNIAVDVGTDAGQIPQFDTDKKLVLQSDNLLSFTENAEEFVFGMFSETFKLRNKTNDTDIFSVVGNDFLINGEKVCLSNGDNCQVPNAAVESVSVSAPLTSSGGTNVSLGLAIDNSSIGVNGLSQLTVIDGSITQAKLNQMGASNGQVLKWNGSAWAPSADLDTDTGITTELDPKVRNFAHQDQDALAVCDAGQTWTHDVMLDGFVCRDIEITSAQISDLALHWQPATGGINFDDGLVGIGIPAPLTPLHVKAAPDGTTIMVDNYVDSISSPGFVFRKARGTLSDPLPVKSGDYLGNFGGRGYTPSGFTTSMRAIIAMKTEEDWTDTAQGTGITFETTTNGTGSRRERLRISNNGYVGIGVSTPIRAFHVMGNGTDNYSDDIFIEAGNSNLASNFPQINLGKSRGTTAVKTAVAANDTLGMISFRGYETSDFGYAARIFSKAETSFSTGVNGDLRFNTTAAGVSADRMIITSTGNVGIGVGVPSEKLHVAGNILATGTITPSDIRLKKNFSYVENPLEKISSLSTVTYDWKDQSKYGDKRQMGVIAQEVKEVFPEAVVETKEGFLAVSYTSLVSPLIGAVKDIYKKVTRLEDEVNVLKRYPASLNDKKALKLEIEELKVQNAKKDEEVRMMRTYLCGKDPSAPFCH